PDNRVFAVGFGVGPAPDIVQAHAAFAAELFDGHEREEVDLFASEGAGGAIGAVDLVAHHGHDVVDGPYEHGGWHPFVANPFIDPGGSRAVVVAGHTRDEDVSTCRERGGESVTRIKVGRQDRSWHQHPVVVPIHNGTACAFICAGHADNQV